jgi:hypothetical protein
VPRGKAGGSGDNPGWYGIAKVSMVINQYNEKKVKKLQGNCGSPESTGLP